MIQQLLLLWSIFQCVAEHYQDFNTVLEKKLAETSFASNSELMHLSFDHGLYWTNSIEIVSKSVELNGNKTGLTHKANVQNERNRNDAENGNRSPRTEASLARWMIDVQNSSLTMRSWRLDAGMQGTTICTVLHSSVEVIDSEIFSNMECSGFVLADAERSGSSRIVIVGISHKSSTQNVLLPLVGREYGQLNKNKEDWMGDGEGWSDVPMKKDYIIGVELSFDSTHFALGTGPLFSFAGKLLPEGSAIGMFGEVSTELRLSSVLNVTSSFGVGSGKSLGVGSCVWERVVGSRIERSTNHDMGTALCVTRLGGNIACVNSSFSSCVRTSNDEIDHQHKNITQTSTGRTDVTSHLHVTSVKFTLCTFSTMTIIGGGLNGGGAAIFINKSQSTLNVTQCFFHKCVCQTDDEDGGAINVQETRTDCPATITLSSFADCKNTDAGSYRYGGSVFCDSYSSVTISDCFFDKSRSPYDGSVSLWRHSLATLSNCAFVLSSAFEMGGALGLYSVTSIDLSFIQFRECSSERFAGRNDIYTLKVTPSNVNSNTVKFCDSTSTKPNVFLVDAYYYGYDKSELVPKLDSSPDVQVSVSINEETETATVTATSNLAVKGTMGILLEGSNVPRLVHVQFGSSSETSTSGTVIVSSGVNGVLPPPTEDKYEHRASAIPSIYLPSLKISAAQSTLKDGSTAEIVLHGVNLGEGGFSMLIQNGENKINISLTRSDSTTLVGEAPLPPSTDARKLEWGTEYEVKKVMWLPQGGIEENVPLTGTITFTTPTEPPRITSVLSCSLNGERTQLTVTFQASLLPDGAGTIKIKRSGNAPELECDLTITETTTCSIEFAVGWEENTTHLAFGTTYSVESATVGSVEVVIDFSQPTFE
ncbi:hypothetical protein BLNAU_23898 [Blattamonas nauphoetae]|uniref:Uncharacterized protein n=1 Tax=Blattamonas nauphoetae TaxID=2049346 RepID=A0ABQ9WPW8_9EUKA|nr:hypothetical protein BLNAU_23898 [Blattamonas nauphoetae]